MKHTRIECRWLGVLLLLALPLAACSSGGGGGDDDTMAPVTSATPTGGTFTEAVTVTLACNDGAGTGCFATFYTTDGSTPDQSANPYAGAIAIAQTTTLRFFSVDNAGNEETPRSQEYVIDPNAGDETPPLTSAAPAGGTYGLAQTVSLSCDDGAGSGCAATHYTTDGSDPDTGSPEYAGPIAIAADTSLKFFSVDLAGNEEAIRTETYVIDPGVQDTEAPLTSASPLGGSYVDAQNVTLTCDDGAGSGCAATYYTTDGSDPDSGSSEYVSAITIAADTTLKFFSLDVEGNQEQIRTEVYQVIGQCQAGVDTDDDGLLDCDELEGWNIDLELNGDGVISGANEQQVHVTSDPLQADGDGDGLDDSEERDRRTNPNRADTDQDGLSDYAESFVYFSSPTDVDSDNDATGPDHDQQPNSGLFDGNEVNNLNTSPQMADTDGDNYTDFEEFTGAGDPLVADLPLISVDIVSNLGVDLDAQIQSGCDISGSTMHAVYSKDSNRSKRKSETSSKFAFAFSADMHAEASGGFDFIIPHASASVSGNTSVNMSTSRESNTSFEQDSVRENTTNFRHYQSQDCFNNQSVDGGSLTATIRINNAGNRSVYLRNLEVGARRSDLANPGDFYSLASALLFDTETTITGGAAEEHEVTIPVSATTAMDLLGDPTGLFFSVNDFEIRDEDGRNFSFIEQTTLNRTGMIEIDYGDGRVERYLVATNVERDASNNPIGVNLAWAMREVLGLDFDTEVNGQGISVLAWVDDQATYSYDASKFKYWFVLGTSDSLQVADFDFEDLVLKQGDFISLTLLQDLDNDGLFDREEDYYGTDPLNPDTDGDMIDDRTEADSPLRHPVVPEFPAGQRTQQVVQVVSTADYSQVWTLVLLNNGSLWLLDEVPQKIDSPVAFESIAGGSVYATGVEYVTWAAISTDGDLYTWGSNYNGKLGAGVSTLVEYATPTRVGAACGCWAQVSVGGSHVLAIRTDGSLWAWGSGAYGQMATTGSEFCPGSTDAYTCRRAPIQVDAGPWFEVAAGHQHSIGIKDSLTLWGWGRNNWGQIGTGDTQDQASPARIYQDVYATWGDDTWRKVAAWGNMSQAVLDVGANEWPVTRSDVMQTWGQQMFTRFGTYYAGSTTISYAPWSPTYQTCTSDAQCPEAARCQNLTGTSYCWNQIAFILAPRSMHVFTNAGIEFPDGPVFSLSTGPFGSVTWGHQVPHTTGFSTKYTWVADASYSWGYNFHGETGRGPGGEDLCAFVNTTVACNRDPKPVVDGNGNPFLFMDRGRGIGNPTDIANLLNPPPVAGELNVWGYNVNGELGLGLDAGDSVTEPAVMPEHPLP